jgi:hypothetical protein
VLVVPRRPLRVCAPAVLQRTRHVARQLNLLYDGMLIGNWQHPLSVGHAARMPAAGLAVPTDARAPPELRCDWMLRMVAVYTGLLNNLMSF